MKKTIALLTDFGLADNYVGIMKAVILNINPNAIIVDISHAVPPQNIRQGALTLKSAYRFFPAGTIFLGVVDPGVGSKRNAVIIKTNKYIFVGPDNGIFSPVVEQEGHTTVYTITNDHYFLKPVSNTFHGRDIFAPAAAHISKGVALAKFGRRQKGYVQLPLSKPFVDRRSKMVKGEVMDIDRFGNLITNIETKHLSSSSYVKIKKRVIPQVAKAYSHVKKGQLLAVIGSKGYLEIAVNEGSAQNRLHAKRGDKVMVEARAKQLAKKSSIKQSDFYAEMNDE